MRYLASLLAVIVTLVAPAARADLPPWFQVPAGWTPRMDASYEEQRHGQLELGLPPVGNKPGRKVVAHGRVWNVSLSAPAGAPRTAAADQFAAEHLTRTGWTLDSSHGIVLGHRDVEGREAWIYISPSNNWWSVKLCDDGSTTARLPPAVPPAPSTAIEKVADDADLPYLPPMEGFKLVKTRHQEGAVDVKNGTKFEAVHARDIASRSYRSDENVSPYECWFGYNEALKKTGWVIDNEHRFGTPANELVQTHYAQRGRDLHARVLCNGKQLEIEMFDAGAASSASLLEKELDEKGSVALYGIYFDIDSDQLRSESEATLRQILELLQKSPRLMLEIQGHTDSTGKPDHNQTLSEKRGASVGAWLVAQKIAAARLTTAGFGATRPVADNRTAEGRAKNRRVELVKRK
jgi:OmpA-OmpF porin, OOP family